MQEKRVPQVRDVYRNTDKREQGRQVVIASIDGDRATCFRLTWSPDGMIPRIGRKTVISTHRLGGPEWRYHSTMPKKLTDKMSDKDQKKAGWL